MGVIAAPEIEFGAPLTVRDTDNTTSLALRTYIGR
jgi:hypothetical protein